MADFALIGVDARQRFGERGRLRSVRRSPPSVCRSEAFPPRVKQVGVDAQLAGNHISGLAAGKPVLHGFSFEGLSELAVSPFCGCFIHGLGSSLFAHFPVRQFDATSNIPFSAK